MDKKGVSGTALAFDGYYSGVTIHDDVELPNKTGAGRREGPDPRPIRLQWHGNPVTMRNIWVVERRRASRRDLFHNRP